MAEKKALFRISLLESPYLRPGTLTKHKHVNRQCSPNAIMGEVLGVLQY